ncbi:MAG: monovalent cation/H+ antiporter complex subunit F [Dehalococcoidia bacterium]|nr:monovalent cation/H+ antiporter complex subunit F [Dehalococcoidia bacterium]
MIEPMIVVYAILLAALFVAFARLVIGPSLPDRVIALDLITVIVVGFIAAYSIDVGRSALLDAALVVALVTFLGTIAFAQYVERRARND